MMPIIGKSQPVRAAALCLSSANRRSSPNTTLAGTECLDIFSPPPSARNVISQALRDSSIETKIAPRSVRIAAAQAGVRLQASSPLEWVGQQPHSPKAQSLARRPWSFGANATPVLHWKNGSNCLEGAITGRLSVGCNFRQIYRPGLSADFMTR